MRRPRIALMREFRCPVCGAVADSQERAENAAFDLARFELLRREAER